MASLEEDIITAVQAMLDNFAKRLPERIIGRLQSVDPPAFVVEGGSVAIPCVILNGATITVGARVAVNQYGKTYVVMGAI